MRPLTKPCNTCNGRGIVPRERRMIGEGSERKPDPLDFRRQELCQKCGGSGIVADAGPTAEHNMESE